MALPFTISQFLGVFESYNLAVWPMHLAAYALGFAAVLSVFMRKNYSNRFVNFVLSFFWLWNGVIYHLAYFSTINKAAYIFGAFFAVQGLLFLVLGVVRNNINYKYEPGLASITGVMFILYAMLVYPLAGYFLGHGYPFSPSFGLAPCPTTIFTFGLLLLAGRTLPRVTLWIPLAWSLIGFNAALNLGILEDLGLLAAGIVGTAIILVKDKKHRTRYNDNQAGLKLEGCTGRWILK